MSGGGLTDAFEAAHETDDLVAQRIRAGVRADLLGQTDVSVRIDRFVILESIGAGAMGVVYAAYDPKLDRKVALKVLRSSGAGARKRILAEARALARLNDPHVVVVHELGEVDNRPFVAMECVEGRSLREVLCEDPLPTQARILELFVAAGRGLVAAHAAGVIHRDFKPDNVVVGDDGRVRVADFGLATLLDAGDTSEQGAGTPLYMAPEQRAGDRLTPATDQYAFCVSLWEALAGVHPFAKEGAKGEPPRWPSDVAVRPAVKNALLRGLSQQSGERWPEMGALLEALVDDPGRRHRARLWRIGGLFAIGAAVLGGVAWAGWSPEPPPPCQGAEAEIASAWNPTRAAKIEAALVGTKVPYARAMWERLQPRLERYRDAWVREHVDTCEGTAVRRDQSAEVMDLRMSCLHRAKVALEAAVDRLESPDLAVVERAHIVVGGLPAPLACADVETLRRDFPLPPSGDRVGVERLEVSLGRATALRLSGDYEGARVAVQAIAADAEALGYAPLQGDVALESARLYEAVGDEDDAVKAARDALSSGLRLGREGPAADAAVTLVFVLGGLGNRYDEAQAYAEVAQALADRTDSRMRQAQLRHAQASVLEGQGQYSQARTEVEEALRLAGLAKASVVAMAPMRSTLGNILRRAGEHGEAVSHLEAAVELIKDELGPEHRDVAMTQLNLGGALARVGEYAAAESMMAAALATLEPILGPEHRMVGLARANLGGVLVALGRYDEAVTQLRSVLDVYETTLPPDDPDVASARNNLALALHEGGHLAEAETELRASIGSFEKALGPQHAQMAQSRENLGRLLFELRRSAEAEVELRAAISIGRQELGPEHPFVAGARDMLARVLLDLGGRTAEATALLRKAWSVRRSDQTPPDLRGATAFALAQVLDDAKRGLGRDEAYRLAQISSVAFGEAGPMYADAKADVDAWIGRH